MAIDCWWAPSERSTAASCSRTSSKSPRLQGAAAVVVVGLIAVNGQLVEGTSEGEKGQAGAEGAEARQGTRAVAPPIAT